ncbi:signal recognition particle-docking protein FtsY [Prauserella marina]|uniref:Signal recognition particle receptor FtsY n=1 Tax=Prauserella marina TaxID=530584 RepID=A0A222VLK8_9PSEU|nr:signal recognition particle-docking protein FtsY [Prauserella marina]ASR34722.1 signal recognition particle-docking protein FtsY [Prauserella marina]PWV85613.1 fused signal recognition particle receptor [Prauserella marina]SDC50430.1 fused signal recognition particle receptor [Prauserella marina]
MSSSTWIWIIVVAAVVVLVAVVASLAVARKRKISLEKEPEEKPKGGTYQAGGGFTFAEGGTKAPEHPVAERTETDGEPGVGDDAAVPRDAPRRGIVDVGLPDQHTSTEAGQVAEAEAEAEAAEAEVAEAAKTEEPAAPEAPEAPEPEPAATAPEVEEVAPAAGRMERLRGRLSKSRSALGQGLLGLLGAGDLDEDSWQDVEDTLLLADLGAATTTEIVERLRTEMATRAVRTSADARALLREVLIDTLGADTDRAVRALPHTGPEGRKQPAVVLVAGVNGTGKTTTTGKLARVLVAQGRQVLLGAADTFRAAAAEQLQTWSERVGAEVVRGKEGADPASVAFDAVKRGIDSGVDAVLVDTAGRLHTKTGLMDELGKVKRVVEKQAEVDEVLLVLDATTGQNGLAQARVFSEVVDVTGIALTKLDGTAKGGIVFQVQRELGVPVKLVGLGEGPDDLAPFEPSAFVDALLD